MIRLVDFIDDQITKGLYHIKAIWMTIYTGYKHKATIVNGKWTVYEAKYQ